MKRYEKPEVEIQEYEVKDVITTSVEEGEKGETGIY